jgi:hypothetical protein
MLTTTLPTTTDTLRSQRIDIDHAQQVDYWCTTLNCGRSDLIDAVRKIGRSAKMVDDFLFLNRKKLSLSGH